MDSLNSQFGLKNSESGIIHDTQILLNELRHHMHYLFISIRDALFLSKLRRFILGFIVLKYDFINLPSLFLQVIIMPGKSGLF
jgi:hypothetical protein